MLSPSRGGIKASRALFAVLVGCALVVAGCFWHQYPARMATHTEVLLGIARKAHDLVATGRFTAESLPELTYPLERATAFASDARARGGGGRASLAAFDALLERYRTYVEAVDRARVRGGASAATLDVSLAALEAAAARVTAALANEH
jgi:hypothetical protein